MEENHNITASNPQPLVWTRSEEFILGMYYPVFKSVGQTWCYTVYPLVKPKRTEPVGFHYAGWSNPDGNITRMRMEGQATTSDECKAMCQAHNVHVFGMKITD